MWTSGGHALWEEGQMHENREGGASSVLSSIPSRGEGVRAGIRGGHGPRRALWALELTPGASGEQSRVTLKPGLASAGPAWARATASGLLWP